MADNDLIQSISGIVQTLAEDGRTDSGNAKRFKISVNSTVNHFYGDEDVNAVPSSTKTWSSKWTSDNEDNIKPYGNVSFRQFPSVESIDFTDERRLNIEVIDDDRDETIYNVSRVSKIPRPIPRSRVVLQSAGPTRYADFVQGPYVAHNGIQTTGPLVSNELIQTSTYELTPMISKQTYTEPTAIIRYKPDSYTILPSVIQRPVFASSARVISARSLVVVPPQSVVSTQTLMPSQTFITNPFISTHEVVPVQAFAPTQTLMQTQTLMPTQTLLSTQTFLPTQTLIPAQTAMSNQIGMPTQGFMFNQEGMPTQGLIPSQAGMPTQGMMSTQTGMSPQLGMPTQTQTHLPNQNLPPTNPIMSTQTLMPRQSAIRRQSLKSAVSIATNTDQLPNPFVNEDKLSSLLGGSGGFPYQEQHPNYSDNYTYTGNGRNNRRRHHDNSSDARTNYSDDSDYSKPTKGRKNTEVLRIPSKFIHAMHKHISKDRKDSSVGTSKHGRRDSTTSSAPRRRSKDSSRRDTISSLNKRKASVNIRKSTDSSGRRRGKRRSHDSDSLSSGASQSVTTGTMVELESFFEKVTEMLD